jgi:NADH-quinone oxidoreductase subunit C
MNQEAIKDKLLSQFGEEVVQDVVEFRDDWTAIVESGRILEVLGFLRDDPELAFNFLSFVGAVDNHPETPRFEMVYQIYSLEYHHRFRVKARLDEAEDGGVSIASATGLWPTADWHERETAEMFGITFENHPDPRKLLLPDGWEVFPLRKDFPLEGSEEDTPDLLRQS